MTLMDYLEYIVYAFAVPPAVLLGALLFSHAVDHVQYLAGYASQGDE